MRDSPSIEPVLREMERGVNSTTHIVYRAALIKIPSCSGGETLSQDLGDCPRLQGFIYLGDLEGSGMVDFCWEVQ